MPPVRKVCMPPQDAAKRQDRLTLQRIAHQAMLDKGLSPDFPALAVAELEQVTGPATSSDPAVQDLRHLNWCSIDNDDSRDLDQLTVAESLSSGMVKVRVAIADVDAIVRKSSAIDVHAADNTTSVYTVAQVFPMLPEKLCYDLTSLNPDSDRMAIVVEMTIDDEGHLRHSSVSRALVRNRAKLAYNAVASWLDEQSPAPAVLQAAPGLDENLRLQDRVAQQLKVLRQAYGALELETIQTRPVFTGDALQDLVMDQPNRAKDLIANFMVAANGVVARFLAANNCPSIQRVVSQPKRWERIVEMAAELGVLLPKEPNSKALEDFLVKEKDRDPLRFPDLSLAVVKLLGRGHYVAQKGDERAGGHFGLAVGDYAHFTAPNRRYPDMIMQRLVKAILEKTSIPYTDDELADLANHCTESEDAAKKVERQVRKSAAALLLQNRVGDTFSGIVTGHSPKGTWVRILHPPVEGRLVRGFERVDIGNKIRVQLVDTDVEKGFIDFKRQ